MGLNKVERQIRSVMQNQRDIAYIFLGSRKHLIKEMFLNTSRPLYRSAGHYPLKTINREHWLKWIKNKFNKTDIIINEINIDSILKMTDGHPFYTQHLCHAIWEISNNEVDNDIIKNAINILIERESYSYSMLWESLTKNQKSFLIGLIKMPGIKPFSSEFIISNKLKSASNIQRVTKTLLNKDLIDHENGSYIIFDRFFKLWIKKQYDLIWPGSQ